MLAECLEHGLADRFLRMAALQHVGDEARAGTAERRAGSARSARGLEDIVHARDELRAVRLMQCIVEAKPQVALIAARQGGDKHRGAADVEDGVLHRHFRRQDLAGHAR